MREAPIRRSMSRLPEHQLAHWREGSERDCPMQAGRDQDRICQVSIGILDETPRGFRRSEIE